MKKITTKLIRILILLLFISIQLNGDQLEAKSTYYSECGKGGSRGGKPIKGGHSSTKRKSTKEKHENADSRRKKEQEKAEQKREESKKKPK